MGRRWGPFGDLTVAPEVAATVGGVAALRELLATSEPTVCCQRCRREVPIATTALSLLAQTSTDDPAEPGFIRVSFAHASCLPSLVVIDPDLADRQLDVEHGHDAVAVRALRPAWPAAALLWEAPGRAYLEPTAGGELRDVLIARYLQQGWRLVTGDPWTAALPMLDGWQLVAAADQLALYEPDERLSLQVRVPPLEGWIDAVRAGDGCALLTGTRLAVTEPAGRGLLAACRAGRVVGAAVAVLLG